MEIIENRVRTLTSESIEPTVQKQKEVENSLNEMMSDMNQHTVEIADLKRHQDRFDVLLKRVESDTNDWNLQRLQELGELTNRIQLTDADVRKEIESARLQIRDLAGAWRGIQYFTEDVASIRQALGEMQATYDARLNDSHDKLAKLSDMMESRMSVCETNLNAFKDEHASGMLSVSKATTAVRNVAADFDDMHRSLKVLQDTTASTALVQEIQKEFSDFMHRSSDSASALRRRLDSVESNTQAHIATASKVLGTATGCQIDIMRSNVLEEVNKLEARFDKMMGHVEVQKARDEEARIKLQDQAEVMRAEYRQKFKLLDTQLKDCKAQGVDLGISVTALQSHLAAINRSISKAEKDADQRQLLILLVETSLLAARMDMHDDQDRQQLALYGCKADKGASRDVKRRHAVVGSLPPLDVDPTVTVDDRCLSCTDNRAAVLSAFKMACLRWKASPILYENKMYSRAELIQCRIDLLNEAKGVLSEEGSPNGDSNVLN